MKATTLLHRDHQEVERLFGELERSRRGNKRSELIAKLQQELETHARIEEDIFYPALESRRDVADRVREARQEHEVVKSLLRDVAAMDPDDEETEAKLKVLRDNVEHHVEEEEGQLFPAAEGLGEQRLEQLGDELAERKRSLSEGMVGGVMRGVRNLIFGEEEAKQRKPRRKSAAKKSRAGAGRRKRAGGRSRSSSRGRARSASRTRSTSKSRTRSPKSRTRSRTASPRSRSGGTTRSRSRSGGTTRSRSRSGGTTRSRSRTRSTGKGSRPKRGGSRRGSSGSSKRRGGTSRRRG